MSEKVVCLGCGLIVDGPGDWGCQCPPPGASPSSTTAPPSSQASPYRSLPPSAPCPRCQGRLAEACFHDATVLDCTDCGGLYLPREVIDAVTRPDGRALRLAFPRRERVPEPVAVRYLRCPLCDGLMNRQNFGMVSGVVVDVCGEHGIWFDAGEINAVVDFVERGGLAQAEQQKQARQAAEKARLHERLLQERRATAEQPTFGRRRGILGRRDDDLVRSLLSWLGDV